jgi:hypothetical protein
MNVVEKYLEKFNQCIILLSGFEQLHLTEYAKNLAENLNFELVKFDHENYNILNNEVNKYAKKGVVAYGLSFEKDKLNFKTTYHISLSGPKTIINDDNKYQTYTDNIKNSFINKFKNIKDLDYHDEIYEDIFNICIDIIMKRVYGDRYEEVQKEYAKLTEKEKFDTPKKSEDDEQKDLEESEVSVGGKRNKKNKRLVIGTRLLMQRIKL